MRCGGSRSSSSGLRTTPAASARWPTTSGSCPPRRSAAACAARVKPGGALAPDRLCVSLVEGWRGEICHVAMTDGDGRFSTYKITDPSFHNWTGLALALREQEISDFPLCNKSFDLSYCGH